LKPIIAADAAYSYHMVEIIVGLVGDHGVDGEV